MRKILIAMLLAGFTLGAAPGSIATSGPVEDEIVALAGLVSLANDRLRSDARLYDFRGRLKRIGKNAQLVATDPHYAAAKSVCWNGIGGHATMIRILAQRRHMLSAPDASLEDLGAIIGWAIRMCDLGERI